MCQRSPLGTMNGNSHRFHSVDSPACAASDYSVDAGSAGSLFNSTSEYSPPTFLRPSAPTWDGVLSASSLPLENSSHAQVRNGGSPAPNNSAPQSPVDLQICVTDPQVCQEPGAGVMPGALRAVRTCSDTGSPRTCMLCLAQVGLAPSLLQAPPQPQHLSRSLVSYAAARSHKFHSCGCLPTALQLRILLPAWPVAHPSKTTPQPLHRRERPWPGSTCAVQLHARCHLVAHLSASSMPLTHSSPAGAGSTRG